MGKNKRNLQTRQKKRTERKKLTPATQLPGVSKIYLRNIAESIGASVQRVKTAIIYTAQLMAYLSSPLERKRISIKGVGDMEYRKNRAGKIVLSITFTEEISEYIQGKKINPEKLQEWFEQ